MNQQDVIPLVYSHNNGWTHLRPHLLATIRALLSDGGSPLHGCTTHATVLCVCVLIEQLRCLPRCIIECLWRQCPVLSHSNSLHAFLVAWRHTDAVSHTWYMIYWW